MKGSKTIIDMLNGILAVELTAINEYFLHARMLDNWGYKKLGEKIYSESIEEMKHAQKLIDRILFLEGLANVQHILKVNIGENAEEMFKADLQMEIDGRKGLVDGIALCLKEQDNVSRTILEEILRDSENHIDWLETQLSIIKDISLPNYLAQQIEAKA
ncbi:MAG: bacterioferritin [Bdellovibrionales bacterium]|nr:bacterioferritin [Bdellovibrionales bacterium]